VLGLTGGIAAYKAAELTRLLVKAGIAVDVVMTEGARHFITPTTLQALSGRPVLTDLWASGAANGMGHIDLSRGADAIVVAPASADFPGERSRTGMPTTCYRPCAAHGTAPCSSRRR